MHSPRQTIAIAIARSFINTATQSDRVCLLLLFTWVRRPLYKLCERRCFERTNERTISNYQFDLWITCIERKNRRAHFRLQREIHWRTDDDNDDDREIGWSISSFGWIESIKMSNVLNCSRCHWMRKTSRKGCLFQYQLFIALLSWTRYVISAMCWSTDKIHDTKSRQWHYAFRNGMTAVTPQLTPNFIRTHFEQGDFWTNNFHSHTK